MDVTVKRSWLFTPLNSDGDNYKAVHNDAPGELCVGKYGGNIRGKWDLPADTTTDTFMETAQSYSWPSTDIHVTYREDGEEKRAWMPFDAVDAYDVVRARIPFSDADDQYIRWQSNYGINLPPHIILWLDRLNTTTIADAYYDTRPDVDRTAAHEYITEISAALAAPEQHMDDI